MHVSPHPDDELIGAPATLFALRDAGHRVANLAAGLGRPEDHDRREAELRDAFARSGFDELIVHDPPLGLSSGDDLDAARHTLATTVRRLVDEREVDLVVSPSPHDRHHAHEVVGRAIRDAIPDARDPSSVMSWMWALWADLPRPTLFVPFDERRLEEVLAALAAYRGELSRNDYRALVQGRAAMNRVLGPERVFGFGSRGSSSPYAELLTEVLVSGEDWFAAESRSLDPRDPIGGVHRGAAIDWGHASSFAASEDREPTRST